jgi:probable rRNA maturation factor
MMSSIHFFSENIQYKIRGKTQIRKWIGETVTEENSITGELCFIFCDDDYLYTINHKYLNHNTLTDIITFPIVVDQKIVSGDIYISIQRVRENAIVFKQRIDDELHRVVIHGVLHLLGYNDSTKAEKKRMSAKEDYYLKKLTEW